MEVWLESLSMHLSVGIPLPSDLLFDIQHYKGVSPSSSGSTTPDAIPSGHRSPTLEPIKEGRVISKRSDNVVTTPVIKISSTESLDEKKNVTLKPIIKMSSKDKLLSKSCEDCIKNSRSCDDFKSVEQKYYPVADQRAKSESYPNYENIDFLKNDTAFAGDTEKQIPIKTLSSDTMVKSLSKNQMMMVHSASDNHLSNNKFSVSLKTVPKNFTRNHFNHVNAEKPEFLNRYQKSKCNKSIDTNVKQQKVLNVSLDNMKGGQATSKVTDKYVRSLDNNTSSSTMEVPNLNNAVTTSPDHNIDIPDIVSSTLKSKPGCSNHTINNNKNTKPNATFNINKSIFKKFESPTTIKIDSPKLTRRLPVVGLRTKKCDITNNSSDLTKPSASSSTITTNSNNNSSSSNTNSIVKSLIDTLNRKEKSNKIGQRNDYGRSSLKLHNTNNKKVETNSSFRSCSPEEFTAL